MAIPRQSLRSFLVKAKAALRAAPSSRPPVTIVIGNESADLDSLTSSILLAYIRSSSSYDSASRLSKRFYVPVLNVPESEVRLRQEILTLLSHANLEPSYLITLDDLPWIQGTSFCDAPHDTQWLLVDQNALPGQLGELYSSSISGVIDHHDEENVVPTDTGREPRIVQKCGSCTSLVIDYCRAAWDALSAAAVSSGAGHAQGDEVADDSAVTKTWDAQIARFAMASILIDTTNLTSSAKVTSHDKDAFTYLEAKIFAAVNEAATFDRNAFYNELIIAKQNLDPLSLEEILKKDYKQWTEGAKVLGISSVIKPFGYLIKKAGKERSLQESKSHFLNTVQEHAKKRRLAVYAITISTRNDQGKHERQLLVWAFDQSCVKIASAFAEDSTETLGLKSWSDGVLDDVQKNDTWRKAWQQQVTSASRKQIAPMLRRYIKSGIQ